MDRHRANSGWSYYNVTLVITNMFKQLHLPQESENISEKQTDRNRLLLLRSPEILKMLRPHQWTKNLFCLAGLIFGGQILEPAAIAEAFLVVATFCAAASAIYIFNDIQDIERDRQHPKKRFRAIASGKISVAIAAATSTFLIVFSLVAACYLGIKVLVCLGLYSLINIAYSLRLKHLPLYDVSCIAFGFVFRLLAGIYAVGDLPTAWITLCTFFLALFLGFAKRRSELLSLLSSIMTQEFIERQKASDTEQLKPSSDILYLQLSYQRCQENQQRPVLSHYTLQFLDSLVNSTATMTVMCYALFTTLSGKNPSLVITVPIVHYAVMHYRHLVMVGAKGEEPDRLLLKDNGIKISILIWLICYFGIIYTNVQLFN